MGFVFMQMTLLLNPNKNALRFYYTVRFVSRG